MTLDLQKARKKVNSDPHKKTEDLKILSFFSNHCLHFRHYGGLTGLNKAETAAKHGEEQVNFSFKK